VTDSQERITRSGSGQAPTAAYGHVERTLAAQRCVVLDGGVGTELMPAADRARAALDEPLWGTRALMERPDRVLDVHARYVGAGVDVVSTNTWGLASAIAADGPRLWPGRDAPLHWMDAARRGLRLAHQAVSDAGRDGSCAVAFSLNADLDAQEGAETIRLLGRLFADEAAPPDLILLETLALLSDSLFATVEGLLDLGLPVWLSFRRCRHGLCGIYGQHWGGPEGDAFGRAARRFEEMGASALLINCIPPDHVEGMVSYLRDFTDLPLGVYPNLGYYTDRGWRSEPGIGGEEYADMALRWREEGAQIIGGCCGVRPHHIAAARARLEGTRPGRRRPLEGAGERRDGLGAATGAEARARWADRRGRALYPLPFPDLSVEPGVAAPGEASYMAWRYVFREGLGARQRCLDMGCGTGILAVQLALNGATHVRALDIDDRAAANTLANAFRNGVDDRVTAQTVDLFPWVPEERYEVIVASLNQKPGDPFERVSSHRLPDYWGRNLLDQLVAKLPEALAPEGVAYLVQLSILSEQGTADTLARHGLVAQPVDYTLFRFTDEQVDGGAQIGRVEELSDAYHLTVGEQAVMVAYLLEVRHAR
jgi:S-methylmethionine-dependent homocysteine/selenocysteine methylase/SAM-dependent methyltransferase